MNTTKKVPVYKRKWFIILIPTLFVIGLIGNLFQDENDESGLSSEENIEELNRIADQLKSDLAVQDIEDTASATQEEEAIEKEDYEEKVTADEKEVFLNSVGSRFDSTMDRYDEIWADHYEEPMSSFSEGSLDIYSAYKEISHAENQYEILTITIDELDIPEELSDEATENISGYQSEMKEAISYRLSAIRRTLKMIDDNNYSPKEVTTIEGQIVESNKYVLNATVYVASLKAYYEITE
ncbi:hypothetical protein [Jeotgalibacillus haloalkalitolerans]|uniref:Uncharacterized protein n=1 Tax=Jeotgalibacillus haloalkalitolerans TaxID=3104292 RepID=A0ABU5KM30_9BACL|nr:hypothetical protein [Jeotgalibacillus sp. HH7-29]MDZ5712225.1 hypothetical protein [Jeotgalibacillus sp. HH7-29]